MKKQLEQRLDQLKAEFESGQKMLAEYEAKEAALRETMIRISGAIQVLEEELNESGSVEPSNGKKSTKKTKETVEAAE